MVESRFLTDRDVAHYLNLSTSWVRGQRYRRRHGLPHVLSVDAINIGGSVRYLLNEIEAFADGIESEALATR
jgi:hypothetical protein